MWRPQWDNFVAIINDRVKPALGCTEPVSTALAAARATELLGTQPEHLEIFVSGNLLKNGMGVGIPGTGLVGLPIAAALGCTCCDTTQDPNYDCCTTAKGLEILSGVTPDFVRSARAMVEGNRVSISIKDTDSVLYSEVIATAGKNTARVIIRDDHTNITLEELNGKPVHPASKQDMTANTCVEVPDMSIASIFEFATKGDLDKLRFILKTSEINGALSKEGLRKDYGLQIGKTFRKNIDKGLLSEDLVVAAMMRSSAASDARMDGAMLPAMSNSGSGNQGISATMPVVAVADRIGASEEQLIRALILSHLSAIHIKSHLNMLSALCGATTAAAGSSVAITWLLGGNLEQAGSAIFNMFGDVTGMFCDGAKTGCSLKVSTSASAAVKAALLALDGIRITGHEGIIEDDLEKTIDNIGFLGNVGMAETDTTILKIMTNKQL
ncbi:L-cysteine desulfidase family protein [Sansalvadorimonas verongulae]|uniref:L-cysteine desulfidase family protein n=1 Tax=Sansalvadorimonas verongulae TaxID=2172824 RepID=UPI0012BB73BB|nr:L-serine ammonia-lyase, iron-sulfur-dependent, subunit alpha [Sansalvadorimonas verongulae]MTI13087.1 serine dehydratase subunit alpha family protein [Sansalvadorimonas verongulae]